MNNQGKDKEDLLRQYIAPERSEEAPEGFTSKVMTRLQLETRPLTVAGRSRKITAVPVISAIVTVLLIASAFLIPGSESGSSALSVLKLINTIKSSLPELNLSSFRLTLPSVIMYVFIGILILTLFDRALYGIFHGENKSKAKS